MTEVKRKRGRPRKKPIEPPVEEVEESPVAKILKDIKKQEDEEIHQLVVKEKKAANGGWDFPIDSEIKFFDRSLSYELTGYKPIDDTHGLDFNPDWFTEARDVFNRTGHYTQFRRHTKAYADFWKREYKRCQQGFTSHGYTITGDHYFFLNYYRLMDLTKAKKAGGGRVEDFPSFYVIQYEWFHYLELCKKLRKDCGLMKARGCGFSEMDAALAANTYNCIKTSNTVIAANTDFYVDKTLDKVWNALAFINDNTDGGFFKLRQAHDTQRWRRASYYKVLNGQRIETGSKSQIVGITADKPNKIRGDRTDFLIYEEGGSWPQSTKAWNQGDALVDIQGIKFGIKIIGGTGGDKGPSLEGLRDIYYNPEQFGVLPYKHNYTKTGEFIFSAFFIPAFRYVRQGDCMDSRGYTSDEKGKAFYNAIRDVKAKTPKNFLEHCSEYCFNAEEAFALEGDNKFNRVILAEQLSRIRINKQAPKVEVGFLDYAGPKREASGFRWTENPRGKIHILEHPLWTFKEIDKIENLYVAGIDSIDIGTADTSAYTSSPSDFCITIKKRAYGLGEPQYVAYYRDRPEDAREAYRIAIRLVQYYNCMINIEATRVSMVTWARDHNYIKYFMRRPRATQPDLTRGNSRQIGSPGTVAIIDHQTDLIAYFIEDYGYNIWFDEMVEELTRYSDENKSKFDIVAAMGLNELADEELNGIIPIEKKEKPEVFSDVGWYVDEKGYKHFGVIPRAYNLSNNAEYKWKYGKTYKTSDPRYTS